MSKEDKTPRRIALEEINAERNRQVTKEGFTEAHDDDVNRAGQLAVVAALYALSTVFQQYSSIMHRIVNWCWPMSWERTWWRPGKPRRRKLVIAGSLLLAELERLARAGELE